MKNLFLIVTACTALTACASVNSMGITASDTSIDTSQKSMLLMTVTVSHQNERLLLPQVAAVSIEKPNDNNKSDRQDYVIDDQGTTQAESNGAITYALRMAIAPGSYTITSAQGLIVLFPALAHFRIPLEEDINVKPNTVMYIGHIDATLRPYKSGDGFAAGPSWPPLPQLASGVSSGTFDVSVSNNWKTDIPALRAAFPVLQDTAITVQPLPAFDRARAADWSAQTPFSD